MAEEMNVLVVDDDPLIREISAKWLSGAGYQPTCLASGEEALVLLGAHPFNLVLLDIVMPGVSGLEVLRRIHNTWPELPVGCTCRLSCC